MIKQDLKLSFVTEISEGNFGLWKYAAIEALKSNEIDLFISHISDQYNDLETKQTIVDLLGEELISEFLKFI